MIAAILFDLDETLHDRAATLGDFLADQHTRFGSRLGHVPLPEWRDRFLTLDGHGLVSKAVVYPTLLSEYGGEPALAEALLADYQVGCCRYARAVEGMTEVLVELRANGVALGIVTNGETELQTRHIETLRLDTLVDTVLISETEGIRKPDPALFERAAHRLDVRSENCLFVGDNPAADVMGAAAAGMMTAWFRRRMEWPSEFVAPPGHVIDSLSEILTLFA